MIWNQPFNPVVGVERGRRPALLLGQVALEEQMLGGTPGALDRIAQELAPSFRQFPKFKGVIAEGGRQRRQAERGITLALQVHCHSEASPNSRRICWRRIKAINSGEAGRGIRLSAGLKKP